MNHRTRIILHMMRSVTLVAISGATSSFAFIATADEPDLASLQAQIDALSKLVAKQAQEIDKLKSDHGTSHAMDEAVLLIDEPDQSLRLTSESNTVSRQQIGRVPDDSLVKAGDFEGSITIPGSTASMRLGGYVQADVGYDFDSLGFSDSLNIRTIPLDGSTSDGEQVFRSHARYSRLNLDIRDDTKFGTFRTFMEIDFFGSGNTFTNNYAPELRHAAAGIGNLYFGQYWSQFTDLASFPEGIDSPLGQPVVRNPGVRWRTDLTEDLRFAVGVEDPAGDLSGDSSQLASDSLPNITGYLQYERPWGRIRLAGLGLKLESTSDSALTGGVNLSGRLNIPLGHERNNLAFSAQAGEGFAHYYATLADAGLEGVVSEDGSVEATGVTSGYLAYQHWWGDKIRSTFRASFLDFDSPEGSSNSALDEGTSFAGNIFWSPLSNTTFGLEYVYADQTVFAGQSGDGSRLLGIARFDF